MKLFQLLMPCILFITSHDVYAQSRTAPELRPKLSGTRMFFSLDMLPTSLKLGTSFSYTVAFSNSLAMRYTKFFSSQTSIDLYQKSFRSTPIEKETEFNSIGGISLILNLKGRDLEGLYLGVNCDYLSRRSTEWIPNYWGSQYTLKIHETNGFYISPTVGYSYFLGSVGVAAELGAQFKTTGDANAQTDDTFYSGKSIAPALRINIGLGF